MLRKTEYCTEYKNGNLTIKYDADKIADALRDPILTISSVLEWVDCYFIGESYCLSNFETGHTIYNLYSDVIYIFPWCFLEDLEAGKTIRLYARQPDENDRETLTGEGY